MASLIPMPLSDEPEPPGLRARVRAFLDAERVAHPGLVGRGGYDRAFSRRLGAAGLVALSVPVQYGGPGLGPVAQLVVAEEMLAAGAPVGAHIAAERQTAPMLLRFGTEEQKREFLPRIAAGEIGFALGMSEPDSGSDLSSVRTRATRVDGGWSLSGAKIWTSWADRVEYAVVLCRSSPLGDDRHEGLSQLVVDLSAPGVAISPIETLDGNAHFSEVSFSEVFVPADRVLGEPGSGWRQVTSELAYERSGPDRWLSAFPVFSALVDAAPHLEDEALVEVGRAAAMFRVLHAFSSGIAHAVRDGDDPAVAAAVVKDIGTGFEQGLVAAPAGLLPRDPDLPHGSVRALRETSQALGLVSPGFTIRGGTTEVLRTIVSRGLLR
ncbi:acyl-CoA dehydrogenase family protein [Pseudonocardia ailaonensis]|uniref:Acyl-CoA dehydrogenase family protein n=1 Tax=Pseudonocardia ailaonensis TaxID=367279 RepID=A0ABN2NI27_9PSEU